MQLLIASQALVLASAPLCCCGFSPSTHMQDPLPGMFSSILDFKMYPFNAPEVCTETLAHSRHICSCGQAADASWRAACVSVAIPVSYFDLVLLIAAHWECPACLCKRLWLGRHVTVCKHRDSCSTCRDCSLMFSTHRFSSHWALRGCGSLAIQKAAASQKGHQGHILATCELLGCLAVRGARQCGPAWIS